jgi:CarD family transcriptional regulator
MAKAQTMKASVQTTTRTAKASKSAKSSTKDAPAKETSTKAAAKEPVTKEVAKNGAVAKEIVAPPAPVVAAAVPPAAQSQPKMPPPRVEQFAVGDKAVYPRGGVAEVIAIEELDLGGNRQRFYVLRLLQNNSKIRVPVGNANAVGLRQLISEQEIQEVFDILRERTIAFDKQTWNRRYRGFMDKIKTGSIYDVAEVLRDLYRLKTDKQLSFGERRMLDEARTLIVKEIAIARGQTEEQVKNEIEAIFLAN